MSEISIYSTTDSQAEIDAAIAARKAPSTDAVPPSIITPAPTPAPAAAPEIPPAEGAAPGETPPVVELTEEQKAEQASDAAKVLAERSKESRFERRKSELQAEIDGLTRRKYDLLRETEEAERRRLQAQPPPPAEPAPAPVAEPPEGANYKQLVEFYKRDPAYPRSEDFDNYEDFSAAQSAFINDRQFEVRRVRETKAEQARAAEQAARQAAEQHQQMLEAHTARVREYVQVHPEYDEIIRTSTAKVSGEMADSIVESVHGPVLSRYLAEHPDEAAELGKLRGGPAYRAMGRLEERLTGTGTPRPATPGVSSAPPPVTPVGGTAAVASLTTLQSAAASGNYQAYKALRQKELDASKNRR